MPPIAPRPRSSVYVGMLALAALAMLLGVALLALELNEYDWTAEATGGPTITLPEAKPRTPTPDANTPAAPPRG